jgi:hypothetical protein
VLTVQFPTWINLQSQQTLREEGARIGISSISLIRDLGTGSGR